MYIIYNGLKYNFVNERDGYIAYRYFDRKTKEKKEIILRESDESVREANIYSVWNDPSVLWQ